MIQDEEISEDDAWPKGWDGHELAQLRRMARLPLSEKLAWLDEAHRIVRHLEQQRKQAMGGNIKPEGGPEKEK